MCPSSTLFTSLKGRLMALAGSFRELLSGLMLKPHSGHPVFPITWVTPHIAAGPAPLTDAHLAALHEQGIVAILNVCEELCLLASEEEKAGFEVHYLPVEDEQAPDHAALDATLDWLDDAVWRGRKVYVHCRWGVGRTGTVLHAYLIRRGLSPRRAEHFLRRLRSRPTSYMQWRSLRRFARSNPALTISTPVVDPAVTGPLTPLLHEQATLLRGIEDAIAKDAPGIARCGCDHTLCCTTPPTLSITEAAVLTSAIDNQLSASEREALRASVIDRPATAPCPLLVDGQCILFKARPLRCRTADMPPRKRDKLLNEQFAAELDRLDKQTFAILAGHPPDVPLLCFPVTEVISGRYVATLFRFAACRAQNGEATCTVDDEPENTPPEDRTAT